MPWVNLPESPSLRVIFWILFLRIYKTISRWANLIITMKRVFFETSKSTGPVHALLADGLLWYEIDTAKDLVKAREQIFPMIHAKLAHNR